MDSYLDNYVGESDDECGRRLCIQRIDGNGFSVSILTDGQPIVRPWYGNRPSTEMYGRYDAEYGLVVELWEIGKGFSLHLGFEPHFELDEQNRDALSVGLSRLRERRVSGRVLRFARAPAALREEGVIVVCVRIKPGDATTRTRNTQRHITLRAPEPRELVSYDAVVLLAVPS